ncbi:4-hydroxy-tetrahydrodipicolinate synthase [Desulfocicer vacuolatum DSM 3385]|uniref:4-hydroxy-tetrahydrodipicolinate synthase n=1 Tax=Desulfocicer vacuolatum DSM 3385 TaxID=1121400 RepID=A0A1W2A6M7_9BACT|nr:4-hydroxy-tetrahydrodipicolinate synthase [Desulfocicer vacuolatum]SMC55918.1 4-hydroxy-tetrahydrodipicolinate synthase [Desulfocicer vacuolatum DSM 3385]
MKTGCYTALITPFTRNGALDGEGLDQLIEFQIENGITGILAAGTTGESPTLKWEDHLNVIADVAKASKGKCLCIAGSGSNNTKEAMGGVAHSAEVGVDAVLMVDPYYNGPSSLEIRREYLEPVAKAFPSLEIIPYIIPGRTGAQLLPEDLAILAEKYKNISCVKEATGNLENMRRTRECCGEDFKIFSGDDGLVTQIMKDPTIKSCGGISVLSNIIPGPLVELVMLLDKGDWAGAEKLNQALAPLLGLVTVSTKEMTPHGEVVCRARNPLALKTLMQILGVPSGPCRRPLGKMTEKGIAIVVEAAKTVQKKNPEILQPLADFFDIDVWERLDNPEYQKDLWYNY